MGRYRENSNWGAQNLVEFVRAVRTAVAAAVGAVRYDSAQGLTEEQQAQARSNICAAKDVEATASSKGLMSAEDKARFDGLPPVASTGSYNDLYDKPSIPAPYVLPAATASSLGGVIVGSGLDVDGGTVSVGSEYVTSGAASAIAGGVAEGLLSSGGYVTSGGASAIVSSYVDAGGYVTSSSVSDVVDSAVSAGGYVTSSGVADVVSEQISSGGYATSAWVTSQGYATSAYVSGATVANASALGGVDASDYVTRTTSQTITGSKTFASGITVSGGVIVSDGNISVECVSAAATVFVDNGYTDSRAHKVALYANTAGNGGVYDTTYSRWLIYNTSAGKTIVPASALFQSDATVSGGLTVSGGITGTATNATSLGGSAASVYAKAADYIPKSGGTASGTLTVAAPGVIVGFIASNTSSLRKIDMRAQNNGNAGIWDTDNGHWMIHANSGGKTAVCYSGATTDLVIEDIGGNAKTVRFPGGMQICYGSGSATTSSGCPISFGSAFAETPTIMAIARPASKPTVTHACHIVSGSTTGGTVWMIDGSTIRGGNIYWMAVGKWK